MKLILLSLALSWAAPHPGTNSSLLTDPEKGLSYLAFGFKLAFTKSDWRPQPKENEGLFAEIHFAQKNAQPQAKSQISLRMDELNKNQPTRAACADGICQKDAMIRTTPNSMISPPLKLGF